MSDDSGSVRPESRALFRADRVDVVGLGLAALLGAVYVLLRPPLFNFDGYVYHLEALAPFTGENLNPHHVLWYPLQRELPRLFGRVWPPGPVLFQLFGIAVSSIALFALYRLLWRVSGSATFAVLGTVFVGFSPKFWFFTLQNQPYPLTYLFLCLYLHCWHRDDGAVPGARRLAAAACCISAAIFFQQGLAVVVPAGVLTLLLRGSDSLGIRLRRAAIWGAATTVFVGAVYVLVARSVGIRDADGFLGWSTTYLKTQHSLQIALPDSVAKSFIGMLRSALPMTAVEELFSDCCSYETTLLVFAVASLAAAALATRWLWRNASRFELAQLARRNAFFLLALLSTLAWAAFVFAWEPLGYYWGLNHPPLLALLGLLLRGHLRSGSRPIRTIACAAVLLLGAVNVAANHERDRRDAVNTPEPLLESLRAGLGPADLFIVLGRDWFDGIDFDLLFECLDASDDDRGRAILHDYVMDPEDAVAWQQRLGEEVNDALDRGSKVFVARHLFSKASFADLMQRDDPFSEYTHEEYAAIDGAALERQIARFFAAYRLTPSPLRVGTETFLELKR